MDTVTEDIMTNKTQSWLQSRNDQIDYEIVLDDMLKCFRRNWWKILLVVILSCTLSYIGARALYRPTYTATSTFQALLEGKRSPGRFSMASS